MAFADGTVCVPVVNFPATYTASTFSFGNPATGTGEVNAIDAATRSLLWKVEFKSPAFGVARVAGDTLLVPVGMANPPQLAALKIGASGFSLKEHQV